MRPTRRASGAAFFRPVALLSTLPLVAQKAPETSPPKYDVQTQTKKWKGTVEEVKLPLKGSEKKRVPTCW